LRDVLGNLVPGSLLVLALYLAIFAPTPDIYTAISAVHAIPLACWIWLVALGWIAGFAIQALGGWLPRRIFLHIRYLDEPYDNVVKAHRALVHFGNRATDSDKQLFERLEIVKECAGNSALSLYLSGFSLALRFRDSKTVFVVLAMFAGGYLLARMHRAAADLQTSVFDEVMKESAG
jgi:hypothetical protein